MSTESGDSKVAVRPVADTGEDYAAFKVEQRGIDLIPAAEKKMKPAGLFWLWAGGVFNVEFLFYGTLIMTFGLSVPQAIAAIMVGNLTYAFLGFASLQGPKTGTTAFMVSRAPFGQNGNRLVALFNWGTQVGFEIEGVYFVVATVLLLFARGHTTLNGAGKVGIIILAVLVQTALPLLGHATISKIFRYMAYVFIVFFVVLAVFAFQRVHLSTFHVHPATLAVWTTALVLLTSVGGLGWTENGNDYSRYLPRSTPGYKTFWAAALGGAIPSILLEILGVLAYTVTTKTVGPAELPHPADVRQLVRGAVPDLRDPPAARDQHGRPVLLRRHPAGPRRAGQALGGGHHRLGGVRRGGRHHLVPRELLQGLRRVPAVHHRVAVGLVRRLHHRLRCCAAGGTTPRRWPPSGAGCTGATAACTGPRSSRSRPAWWPR